MLDTPVAFIIFNRPDLTEIVFEAIRQAKPKKLLVIADGPRFPEEAEKCEKARAVIKKVDWECEVLTNFSDKNLGCKRRVSSGIDWVFSEVEEAIILEDDCLPTQSFFYFCQTLLDHYRHDERVMHIGSNNFQNGKNITESSYYFSKYPHIWGWASWRRAWQYYDIDMKTWLDYKKLDLISLACNDSYEHRYWTNIFEGAFSGAINTTWDYQWTYAIWCQNGLSIVPQTNLVSNLGFREDATNTFGENPLAKISTTDIWEISHPCFLLINQTNDTYTFDYLFDGRAMKEADTIRGRIRRYATNIKQGIKKLVLSRLEGQLKGTF
jgi:hypothetical protein